MPSPALNSDISLLSVSAVVVVLTAVIPLFKLLLSLYFERHKINLKKLEIVDSVLSKNLKKPSIKQRYLAEKIFTSIYKCDLSYDEIYVLLKFANPSRALDLYTKASLFIELSNKKNSFRLKSRYRSIQSRVITRYLFDLYQLALYFIFAFFGVWVLLFTYNFALKIGLDEVLSDTWLALPAWMWFLALVVMALVSLACGVKSILTMGKIKYAFALVDMSSDSLNR